MASKTVKKGQISKGDLIKAGKAIANHWGVEYAGYSTDYDKGIVVYKGSTGCTMEIPLSHIEKYI